MGRHQDILDVFRFRGRKLSAHRKAPVSIPGGIDRGTIETQCNATQPVLTLIFVAPFTDFSKLWDIVAGLLFFSCGRAPSWAVVGIRRMPQFQIATREGGEEGICATIIMIMDLSRCPDLIFL